MSDVSHLSVFRAGPDSQPASDAAWSRAGLPPLSKRVFDRAVAMALLMVLVPVGAVLVVLNPFLNAGPLIYRQDRMGYQCRRFAAFKFRTMRRAKGRERGAFDALEADRITVLGRFLRRSRLDELPQIINVLRGEMSLIGPRPDSYDHACVYLRDIAGYAERHSVRPGISGLAQTEVGYVDGIDGIRRKVAADLHYIAHASFRLDLWIAWRTIGVVLARKGA
ncbi:MULTISPECIES: sugar transferase [unclassified Yoonia]|uniref:sugar transferase n=1 Tax=unclassified Yoonia TaxID=2629118 RepID=UPI002AFF823C|nr:MULTISPECIES: sugar transferase [unclassified Yoonia]